MQYTAAMVPQSQTRGVINLNSLPRSIINTRSLRTCYGYLCKNSDASLMNVEVECVILSSIDRHRHPSGGPSLDLTLASGQILRIASGGNKRIL